MPVIALVGNKGGAGKTTLSINVASALAEKGSTHLLDADPQLSSFQWHAIADGQAPFAIGNASESVAAAMHSVASDTDYVLIDCPPSIHSRQTGEALARADLVLIPVQPSPLDLWASVQIADEVERARADNPKLKALLVINQMEPRTKLSQLMRDALDQLDVDAAQTAIRRRMIYRNAIIQGRSVLQVGSRGKQAAEEIRQLTDEMVNLL